MRYLSIVVLLLFTISAQAQTDSLQTRTEYKAEDDEISTAELKRFFRYITRANVEEKTLIKVGIWPAAANQITTFNVRPFFQFGLSTDLSIERKLTPAFSVLVGFNNYLQFNSSEILVPSSGPPVVGPTAAYTSRTTTNLTFVKAGIRHYYAMPKRIRTGKSANNFSGNYVGLQLSQPLLFVRRVKTQDQFGQNGQTYILRTTVDWVRRASSRDNRVVQDSYLPAISMFWGIQRRLGERGYVDLNLGPEIALGNPAANLSEYIASRQYGVALQFNASVGFGL